MTSTQHAGQDLRIVIIGAGMAGILSAIRLRESGYKNFVIYEKSDRLGGTWRENTYPGIACDVPAHLYTYSFEPNPEWSSTFASGPEIQAYFERVAEKYDVLPYIRFNEAVPYCAYEDGRWRIRTSSGREDVADFVIAATGVLHHPHVADIPGLDSFAGACFHSAQWDHSVPLEGQRVGVIGTG
ncbi:MAG: NAD(P)/FAD-dependent oxidoreductase, partial [Gammaproteobacteria bacterium]